MQKWCVWVYGGKLLFLHIVGVLMDRQNTMAGKVLVSQLSLGNIRGHCVCAF